MAGRTRRGVAATFMAPRGGAHHTRTEPLLMQVRAQVCWKRCQTYLRHLPLLQQPGNTGAIGSRPRTPGTARSEASRVRLLVDTLDRAIDPAETQCLFHRIIV